MGIKRLHPQNLHLLFKHATKFKLLLYLKQLLLSTERQFHSFLANTMASDSVVQLPSGRVQTSNKAQNNNQKAKIPFWGHQQDTESVHETESVTPHNHGADQYPWELSNCLWLPSGRWTRTLPSLIFDSVSFTDALFLIFRSSENFIHCPTSQLLSWWKQHGQAFVVCQKDLEGTYLQIQLTWTNNASLFNMSSFSSDAHHWILELHDNRHRPSSGLNSEPLLPGLNMALFNSM